MSGLGYEIAQTKTKNKAEFTGRFFVKVYKDASLMEYIVNANANENYSIINTAAVSVMKNGFNYGRKAGGSGNSSCC